MTSMFHDFRKSCFMHLCVLNSISKTIMKNFFAQKHSYNKRYKSNMAAPMIWKSSVFLLMKILKNGEQVQSVSV